MPIYEYQCQACNYKTEIIQKFSDPPETQCPECNENALHKNVTAPSFHLAGSGWYATDYKDKPAPAKTDQETTPTDKSATEKTAESTSASTSKETPPAASNNTATAEKPKSDEK